MPKSATSCTFSLRRMFFRRCYYAQLRALLPSLDFVALPRAISSTC